MKKARRFRQFNKRHLKLVLGGFFLALIIPTAFLVYQAYDQIKWEAFHQQRQLAEELTQRIDNQFIKLISEEEQRTFTDYSFLNIAGDAFANVIQRSPLSNLEYRSSLPGMIGYFQIDEKGVFSSPLLPDSDKNISSYGISEKEYTARAQLKTRIYNILKANELVRPERGRRLADEKKPATDEITIRAEIPASSEKPAGPVASPTLSASSDRPSYDSEVAEQDSINDNVEITGGTSGKQLESGIVASNQTKESNSPASQAGFDKLSTTDTPELRQDKTPGKTNYYGKLDDLKLEKKYDADLQARREQVQKQKIEEARRLKRQQKKRKEKNILPEATYAPKAAAIKPETEKAAKIEIFESEIDPFEFNLLKSGEFVLFRKAWIHDNRYIQGILFDSNLLINQTIMPMFRNASLAKASDLAVAYNGDIFSVMQGQQGSSYSANRSQLNSSAQLQGALLYRTRLSPPLNDIELVFSIRRLPTGPGGKVIIWSAIILTLVLISGFLLMYRLGAGQLELSRQQQDFVSAVSHELKTPLTSIRMYGEMLREGWASEEKKRSYYDYIFYESERLSRLIQNVLQLARMTRNEVHVELTRISVAELIDTIRSKVTSQIERNNFSLVLDCSEQASQKIIEIDQDYFSQIIINLVDNAIKFSKDAEQKKIKIRCYINKQHVTFSIRDFGPGIAKDQLKKIFSLFYRSENELTRKTMGTGIGLALVHQLTAAMHGSIDVISHQPGAEFILSFPIINPA